MANQWLVHLTLLVAFQAAFVFGFNLDRKDPFVYRGAQGEYFGYAVAVHAQNDGKRWVVVGAPLGNKTSPINERNRYGTVYKCYSHSTKCEVITIDDNAPANDLRTGQWLGATLATSPSQEDGKLMVCAPRYSKWSLEWPNPEDRERLLLGKCFVVRNNLDDPSQDEPFEPCYDKAANLQKDDPAYKTTHGGVCQAGFSGATSRGKFSQTFVMGLPGFFSANGSIALYEKEPSFLITAEANRKVQDIDTEDRASSFAMGYAVAIGRFRDPNREELVSSSLRAAKVDAKESSLRDGLNGKVMAFNLGRQNRLEKSFTLPLPKNIQPGSNFGQSLCAVDLNSDSYSDLLVAAPYHGEDEGRVYVYMNNGQTPGTLNHVPSLNLVGPKTKRALFGFAMAIAGDLNKDGYPDVAISAPYGGKDQGGEVYIYFGKKDGIETSPRQIIKAPGNFTDVKTFGYSLAGNLDVDNNNYPDLVVGAYSSDKAFLLRSRPIVDMEGNITLNATQIELEDNSTMQIASDGVLRKSIEVTVCLKFKNQWPNPSFPSANVTYSIELDKSRSEATRRIFFLQGMQTSFKVTRQVTLPKENERYCQFKHIVYLREKEKILSVIDPLTFDLVYDLDHSSSCVLCPILNNYDDIAQRSFTAKANFIRKCGPDKICEPDLSVKGQVRLGDKDPAHHNDSELYVGHDNEMTVRVVVENKAQDSAYDGKVIVTYPSIIDYSGSNQGVKCSPLLKMTRDDNTEEKKIACEIGNPFGENAKKQFDVRFDTKRVTGNISVLRIHLEATSPNKDANSSDNTDMLSIGVRFEADLSISGISRPDQVVYNDKTSEVTDVVSIGPSVKNIITVKNNGPSPVEYTEVTVMIPFKNKAVDEQNYLLYLTNVQVLGNAGSCNIRTNPLDLQFRNDSTDPTDQVSSLGKPKRDLKPNNEELPCEYDSSLTCLKVPCYLGRMKRGDQVQIQLTSRLWRNTLIKANAGSVTVTTTAEIVPSSSVPELNKENNKAEIPLIANPKTPATSKKSTAVWIYIVSVLGGLALLALAGIALYKFGFFKRKRAKKEYSEEEVTPMRTLEPGDASQGPANV